MPTADRRRSETDNRPMLDPREGRGEVVLGLTGAGPVPGDVGGMLRRGKEEEVDEERDGGREFKSGAIAKEKVGYESMSPALRRSSVLGNLKYG